MRTKLFLLTFGILLISSISSITIYGGESHSFKIDFIDPVYIVTGNSSNLSGLDVTFNGTHIRLDFAQNYKPDNFTLIFFDKEVREVTKEIRVGGGTRTIVQERNITEYIEIPKYIEKEVEEVPKPEIIKETPKKIIFVIIALLILLLWTLYKNHRVVRRYENGRTENEEEK